MILMLKLNQHVNFFQGTEEIPRFSWGLETWGNRWFKIQDWGSGPRLSWKKHPPGKLIWTFYIELTGNDTD